MTTPRIEEQTIDEVVNKVIDALVADVHFEKTWPAHTAYYQIDLNQFQKKLRQALTEAYQAGIDEAVEKMKKNYIEPIPEANGSDIDDYMRGYNQALDDTIKALETKIKDDE